MHIEIGGLRIHGSLVDVPGLVLKHGGLQGWSSRPAVTREDLSRPSAHGSYATDGYWGARIITLNGYAFARSHRELDALRERFMAAVPASDQLPFRVEDERGVRWAYVQAWGEPDWSDDRWRRAGSYVVAEWVLQLRAPLPWKYGIQRVFEGDGNLELESLGTQNAWPVIQFWGPRPSVWTARIGDREMRFARSLSASQWVEVHTRSGIVRSNAVQGGYLLQEATGPRPFVPPGQSSLIASAAGRTLLWFDETYL